jgi:hypothetical protein
MNHRLIFVEGLISPRRVGEDVREAKCEASAEVFTPIRKYIATAGGRQYTPLRDFFEGRSDPQTSSTDVW